MTIEMYCVGCKKNTAKKKKNSSVRRTKQNSLIFLSNCVVYRNKKSRFIKNQGANRLVLQ